MAIIYCESLRLVSQLRLDSANLLSFQQVHGPANRHRKPGCLALDCSVLEHFKPIRLRPCVSIVGRSVTSWCQDATRKRASSPSVCGRYGLLLVRSQTHNIESCIMRWARVPCASADVEPLKGFITHLLSFEYAGGQSFGSGCLHELVFSCAERGSRDPPHQNQAASTRYASHPSMPMPCPAPRPVKYPSQWRGPAAAAASAASQAPEPQLHRQVVREQPAERPAAQQLQPIQEDGSGYMSTESDSDTETNDKALVWHLDAYFKYSVTRCCC